MSETIVFFGSGPVAARSLELLSQDFLIEAVVTKPKPVHHRGSFPVIDVAEKLGLPIKTAQNKHELSSVVSRAAFKSRVGVLIDFGIIVSQDVIDSFSLGIVNSHFSILPEWRGADPITFAILSGQDTTGVSLMLLVEALDEGPLLAYGEHTLSPTVTTPELTDYLIQLSYSLLVNILPGYLQGGVQAAPQAITGRKPSYSRKLTKEDGLINWDKPARVLEREIRAFIEWPKSRTTLADRDIVITQAHAVTASGRPGQAVTKGKELLVFCSEGALSIKNLKPSGKNEMPVAAFLAGYGKKL